jgi:SAM-dependent methyltransferase
VTSNVFDQYVDDDYEAACERGLQLSGESRDYFARHRVEQTRALCQGQPEIRLVVDFGCGLGHTTPHVLSAFPNARVIGTDSGEAVIQAARQHYSSARAQFTCGEPAMAQPADLVYCNGVFHHIERAERTSAATRIFGWLRSGGLFAFWENNPWNPGTRLVMSRIPFDRDADPLSPPVARQLLTSVGFRVLETTFCFFFPSQLKALRGIEPRLRRIPLGGQYCVLAQKPDGVV